MTPNRSTSYRGSEVAAISIAQHMMPKTNGQVELRFAQLKNSPTKPAFSLSRTAPPGPRLKGASMFSPTHRTKSFDRKPTMLACSARWIIGSGPPRYGRQIALRQAGHDTDVMDMEKGFGIPPQTISPIQMTYTQRHNSELVPGRALRHDDTRSYAIASQATGLKGFEPLTYRCPSDVGSGRADKSRSLYLAKLQARGRAYRPGSVKRCVTSNQSM